MDQAALTRFRSLLESKLAELQAADILGRQGQETVNLDQQALGRLSRQDALINQSMARATQARRNAQRKRLHLALQRIEDGEYGYCTDCGEPISEKRLELDPAVPRCFGCAQG